MHALACIAVTYEETNTKYIPLIPTAQPKYTLMHVMVRYVHEIPNIVLRIMNPILSLDMLNELKSILDLLE